MNRVLKLRIKDVELEFSGDIQDIDHIISKLVRGEYTSNPNVVNILESFKSISVERMPNYKEIMEYILSKPDYVHTITELQEHFLGKKVPSNPPNKSLWWQFHSRVRLAQERIEKEKGGKFIGKWERLSNGHKHRIYKFEKSKPESIIPETLITIGEKAR